MIRRLLLALAKRLRANERPRRAQVALRDSELAEYLALREKLRRLEARNRRLRALLRRLFRPDR